MNERPILFSGSMVQCIEDGRKRWTRRAVDMRRLRVRLSRPVGSDLAWLDRQLGREPLLAKVGTHRATMNPIGAVSVLLGDQTLGVKPGEFDFVCPYMDGTTILGVYAGNRKAWTIIPSESRLWVRERWVTSRYADDQPPSCVMKHGLPVWYAADGVVRYFGARDGGPAFMEPGKGRPSIHLPRDLSRILLDTVSGRLERLHDIDEEGAIWEGVGLRLADTPDAEFNRALTRALQKGGARDGFAFLWDHINGRRAGYAWKDNPWVWAVEFDRVRQEAPNA